MTKNENSLLLSSFAASIGIHAAILLLGMGFNGPAPPSPTVEVIEPLVFVSPAEREPVPFKSMPSLHVPIETPLPEMRPIDPRISSEDIVDVPPTPQPARRRMKKAIETDLPRPVLVLPKTGGSRNAIPNYKERIRKIISTSCYKTFSLYPLEAFRERKVVLEVVIRKDGTLVSVRTREGSGSVMFDAVARKAVRNAAPFPPFPPGLNMKTLKIIVPIKRVLEAANR